MKNVIDDTDNQDLSYVVKKDIKECFADSQVLVLEAPIGATLTAGVVPNKVIQISLILLQS